MDVIEYLLEDNWVKAKIELKMKDDVEVNYYYDLEYLGENVKSLTSYESVQIEVSTVNDEEGVLELNVGLEKNLVHGGSKRDPPVMSEAVLVS